jgi:hypothetical protein
MAVKNLAQHEQLLKALEKSIREISEKQNEVEDAQNKAWHLLNKARNMTMQLFVIADDLRTSRLEFEKQSQES